MPSITGSAAGAQCTMTPVVTSTVESSGSAGGVELGVLHGTDDRFAQAMIATVPADPPFVTRLNEPYSAADGVAHTLDAQGMGKQ